MNLVVDAPVWLLALLGIALAAAAIEDAARLRISNLTCIAVLVTAIVAMALHHFPAALWPNAVVFAAILAAGTLAFSQGWLGGGDVKLLAALGLWVNFSGALLLLSAAFLAGGVLALAYLTVRVGQAVRSVETARKGHIPYGLAIAAGALIAFGIQTEPPGRPKTYIPPHWNGAAQHTNTP